MRAFTASVLALALVLSSLALASARGASHDIGMEVVICSGVGMMTVTIGPDGELVETKEVCPDGSSIFAASFVLPGLVAPASRLITTLAPRPVVHPVSRDELTPSARGPPILI